MNWEKQKRLWIICGGFVQWLLWVSGVCGNPSDSDIQTQILKGIEKTVQNDFQGAKVIYQKLIQQYPEQPMGYFYLAAAYQAEIIDSEDYQKFNIFKSLMKQCIELAEKQRSKTNDNVWSWFYEGSAYLYCSFMDSKRNKNWQAYRNALKGVSRLEKAIQIDSTFYEAYLGVGSYKYWKSEKTKSLSWFPFISDEREIGVRMIRKAIENSQLVKLVGKDQLAWVCLSKGDLEIALQLARSNCRLYPESRFFTWTLVEIYYRGEQWENAYKLYHKLLTDVRGLPGNNHYNEIICLLRMSEICYLKKDYLRGKQFVTQLLEIKLSESVARRIKPKLKRALELQKICSDAS